MAASEVVILGGGVGGLATALALARSGIEATVIEHAQSLPPDYWGFVIWPPGMRTLQSLGVFDRVQTAGCKLTNYRWYTGNGREWMAIDLRRLADVGEWNGILPSRLVNILQDEAERNGVRIIRGAHYSALDRNGSGSFKIEYSVQGNNLSLNTRLIIGADGPHSPLRQRVGLKSWRWRPPAQTIVTGIGGGLLFNELRQAIGTRWSGGCVALGGNKSWLYATIRQPGGDAGLQSVQAYGLLDQQAKGAIDQLVNVIEVRPWSVHVHRWASDGIILMGDAAHSMLPHLGLGANLTLEDVPALVEVVGQALRTGDTSAKKLAEFQDRRKSRVAYARRVSELWALSITSRLPGVRFMRDLNFLRLSKHQGAMETFLRELAGSESPRLRTRLNVWLP
jgi:2-polyprenyl-6-methoxyphenol hydroxylase-like FAD-dependent oxidoreductase